MQGSFPPGSSSTNRQDSIWHDRGAVNEHADRQYNPARGAAPRNPSPDVQHGLHNGLRSSPRLFQFNPNVLPDRHESSTADNEPAVSLPPDAGSKYAHTEGTSTAAAYNSPLLHTTRTAQRRFKANTLHGEYDQSFHNSDREGTPAATTRPFPQTYKSSRSAKVHLVPQSNGHVYTVTASPTALKDTHATPPNRFLPQVLDLLPPVVQRLWKRRRKRSLSSDVRGFAASESHFARSTARLRLLLVICIGLSSLLYLFHPSKSPSVPPRPSKIEAGAIPDQSSKGIVPTWKWWSPQQTAASKPKRGK